MTERLEKLINFLRKEELLSWQMFFTQNFVDDPIVSIYDEDDIVVNRCYYYVYVEVLGLNKEEIKILKEERRKQKRRS